MEAINLNSLLSRITEFNVKDLNIKNEVLKLKIKVQIGENLQLYEQLIKNRYPEYQVQILFYTEEESEKQFKKIIGISSGKGGVGKSVIAMNLALSLSLQGCSVGILDADIYSPSIAAFLRKKDRPISSNGYLIDPIKSHGIEFLSMGSFLAENESLMWKDDVIGGAFKQFIVQGNWKCEYLIIDFAGGMNSTYEVCKNLLPNMEIFLIALNDSVVYRSLLRMYSVLASMNFKVLGIIENMSNEFYSIDQLNEINQSFSKVKRICCLPYDKNYKDYEIEKVLKGNELKEYLKILELVL